MTTLADLITEKTRNFIKFVKGRASDIKSPAALSAIEIMEKHQDKPADILAYARGISSYYNGDFAKYYKDLLGDTQLPDSDIKMLRKYFEFYCFIAKQ